MHIDPEFDWLPEDSQLELDDDSQLDLSQDSQLDHYSQLAGEVFEEDNDGDDYRARRIWL